MIATEEVGPWRDGDNSICARVYASGNQRLIAWTTAGLFAFRIGEPVVRVWPAGDGRLELAKKVFAQHLRPLILQSAGFQVLHASAVAGSRGVVAFCGRSGAGKSTLAALLAGDLLARVADDAVVIDSSAEYPTAVCFPFVAHRRDLRSAATQAAGSVLPFARIVILERIETAASAGVLPRAADVTGAAALTTVLAHAKVFDSESAGDSLVDAYARLLNVVPVTAIYFRHDAARIPELLEFVRTTIPELSA